MIWIDDDGMRLVFSRMSHIGASPVPERKTRVIYSTEAECVFACVSVCLCVSQVHAEGRGCNALL